MSDGRTACVRVLGSPVPRGEEVLTSDALVFVAELQVRFGARRDELLGRRHARRAEISRGARLDFLPETRVVRDAEWMVAPAPGDLVDRRVEITGPPEPKMAVNALNSGARVWLADLEDANTPHWRNVVTNQIVLADAVRRRLSHAEPDGRQYRLRSDVPGGLRPLPRQSTQPAPPPAPGGEGGGRAAAGRGLGGGRTEAGLRTDVDVGLRYLEAWLRGNGAVGIHNLMEDAATAEISRSQVWQWVHNRVRLDTGQAVTAEFIRRVMDEELAAIRTELGEQAYAASRFQDALALFEHVALTDDFPEFLTLSASQMIQ